jgi:hypothetical protein
LPTGAGTALTLADLTQYLNISAAGTSEAGKVMVTDANNEIDGIPVAERQSVDPSQKVTFFDDFLAAAIDGRISSTAGAGTGNAAATTVANGLSGEITIKSASDDGTHAENGTALTLDQLNFMANQGGLALETRIKVDAITAVALFIGFTDAISTTVELPIFKTSGADTIDSDAANACGIAFDTDGTTDQWFIGGVKANTDTDATHSGSAPVADTYVVLRVEVSAAGAVTGYINGTSIGTVADAVTVTTALTPSIVIANRGANQRTATIDYLWVQQDR